MISKINKIYKIDKIDKRINWESNESYLYFSSLQSLDLLKNKKIACFDLDDTLIKTKSGETFSISQNDWELFDDKIFIKLFELQNNGFKLVIVTNQKGISNGKTNKIFWMNKIESLALYLNLEITLFCSLCDDNYRKPRTTFWDQFIRGNLEKSFYCGDAGGQQNDFSDTDLKFAKNIGIKFIHRNEFLYGNKIECVISYPIKFNELSNLNNQYIFIQNKPEVIMNVGFPASGKSSFSKKYILTEGYEYINQDILKTEKKCLEKLSHHISNGKSVVIDNTNLTIEKRRKYIDIINKYKLKLRCLKFSTPIEICEHNSYFRNFITKNEVKVIPKIVFNVMKKKYQEPNLNEGFYKIEEIKFNLDLNDKEKEIYEKYYF